nr:MAG TPA: hypothetical protein [Caudoviricetes sp.]
MPMYVQPIKSFNQLNFSLCKLKQMTVLIL